MAQKLCKNMSEPNTDMQSTTHKLTQMYNAIALPSMRLFPQFIMNMNVN